MKLHNKILLALVLAAMLGVVLRAIVPGSESITWIVGNVAEPVGKIFLRLLLLTVVPLVFCSLILGVAGIGDIGKLGKLGGATLLLFLLSTACAATLGILLFHLVEPGTGISAEARSQLLETYRSKAASGGTSSVSMATLVDIVPANPLKAAVDMQLLSVIFVSLLCGVAITRIPAERAAPVLAVLQGIGDIVTKIIDIALAAAPYGVFALIFATTWNFGVDVLAALGSYLALVIIGLLIHGAVTLSSVVFLFGRRSPLGFWRAIRSAMLTAFSTSSSAATLPTSIAVAERELAVPPRIAGFVLPLGATLNMNGTALYEGVTVLFLAQLFGVHLELGQQILVVLMSVITAVGAAGVPGGSLPLLMGLLASVGVPAEGIAVILGLDRLLDMSRTALNVTGDLAAAVVIARLDAGGVKHAE
ncbi:MAG: dicarboxylate/amino acid:cation symporter [Planctomycetota bacterium]